MSQRMLHSANAPLTGFYLKIHFGGEIDSVFGKGIFYGNLQNLWGEAQ